MNRSLFILLSSLFTYATGMSQTPGVKWSKYISAQGVCEGFYDGIRTSDKGYLLVGYDTGWSIQKNQVWNKTNCSRGWMVKTDSLGSTIWFTQKNEDGYNSAFTSVQEMTGPSM